MTASPARDVWYSAVLNAIDSVHIALYIQSVTCSLYAERTPPADPEPRARGAAEAWRYADMPIWRDRPVWR